MTLAFPTRRASYLVSMTLKKPVMAMPPRGGITASRIAHLLSWSSSRVTAAMTRTRCMPERRPALLRRSAEVLHSIGAARAGVGGRSGRAHLRQHLPAALALEIGRAHV